MEGPKIALFVLFALVLPVSSDGIFSSGLLTCYILDFLLITYCVVATALYFREKFSFIPSVDVDVCPLERPEVADPYRVLESPKRKRKAGKKKKPQATHTRKSDEDLRPSLAPSASAPHRAPHLSPRQHP